MKQPQEDNALKSVYFFSRKLTDTQKKKKAIFIECLAIKEAILYWQFQLLGKKFFVFTDHRPLENFNIKKSNDMELVQILNYISQFDFEIVYNPGKDNIEADCLSRNPVLESHEDTDNDSVIKTSNLLKLNDIKENQKLLKVDDKCIIKDDIIYKILNNISHVVCLSVCLSDRELLPHLWTDLHENGTKMLQILRGRLLWAFFFYFFFQGRFPRKWYQNVANFAEGGCCGVLFFFYYECVGSFFFYFFYFFSQGRFPWK